MWLRAYACADWCLCLPACLLVCLSFFFSCLFVASPLEDRAVDWIRQGNRLLHHHQTLLHARLLDHLHRPPRDRILVIDDNSRRRWMVGIRSSSSSRRSLRSSWKSKNRTPQHSVDVLVQEASPRIKRVATEEALSTEVPRKINGRLRTVTGHRKISSSCSSNRREIVAVRVQEKEEHLPLLQLLLPPLVVATAEVHLFREKLLCTCTQVACSTLNKFLRESTVRLQNTEVKSNHSNPLARTKKSISETAKMISRNHPVAADTPLLDEDPAEASRSLRESRGKIPNSEKIPRENSARTSGMSQHQWENQHLNQRKKRRRAAAVVVPWEATPKNTRGHPPQPQQPAAGESRKTSSQPTQLQPPTNDVTAVEVAQQEEIILPVATINLISPKEEKKRLLPPKKLKKKTMESLSEAEDSFIRINPQGSCKSVSTPHRRSHLSHAFTSGAGATMMKRRTIETSESKQQPRPQTAHNFHPYIHLSLARPQGNRCPSRTVTTMIVETEIPSYRTSSEVRQAGRQTISWGMNQYNPPSCCRWYEPR